jgi:hypothetical protein
MVYLQASGANSRFSKAEAAVTASGLFDLNDGSKAFRTKNLSFLATPCTSWWKNPI